MIKHFTTYLILTSSLQDNDHYLYFTDENKQMSANLRSLLKVTALVSGRAMIQIEFQSYS